MIARLKGMVDGINDNNLIIDVSGVGYQVFTPSSTLTSVVLGEYVKLEIVTVVREDSFTLYGFHTQLDKQWFDILTSVQGVGAKVSLAIQSVLTGDDLYNAVASGDSSAFARANGVGPKLASRIVLELKDKVSKIVFINDVNDFVPNNSVKNSETIDNKELDKKTTGKKTVSSAKTTKTKNNAVVEDAISALVNLGYSRSQAFTAVGKSIQKIDGDATVAGIIPLALQELNG